MVIQLVFSTYVEVILIDFLLGAVMASFLHVCGGDPAQHVKGDLDNLIGDGGRLFMVISEADNLVQAQDNVYSYLSKLDLPACFYRHDIGNRALRD